MRKSLFNYSFYSHAEIGNFRVWHLSPKSHFVPWNESGDRLEEVLSFSRGLCSSRLSRQKPAWPVSQTGLTDFALWVVEKCFWARKSLLCHDFFCSDVERLLRCFGSLGRFWTKSDRPVSQTGLTGFPWLREAKSNKSDLTGFRNWPDRFGLPAAVSCVFPLRVCCGCWLGLALGSVALQWLRELGKRSLRRCTSELGFMGRILE
jgi:hypothetical protein